MARSSALALGVYTEGGEARAGEAKPFFSIVIPTYNREAFIGRALQSCLAQDLAGWEAIVVDDASLDRSADVAAATGDPRVRLVRHEHNLGVCPARNSGVRAARGEWIVFLDSDDELLPGALRLMHDAARRAPGDVHRLIFSLADDAGAIGPQPPLTSGAVWEYRHYIEWVGRTATRTDFLNCIRRDVFDSVAWPEGHAFEPQFHFELARRFRTECHSDVVAVVHADAPNRSGAPDVQRALRAAADVSDGTVRLLDEHGDALRRWAPAAFASFVRMAAVNSFLAGKRGRGIRYALMLIGCTPFAPAAWAILGCAMLSRGRVARLVALKRRSQS